MKSTAGEPTGRFQRLTRCAVATGLLALAAWFLVAQIKPARPKVSHKTFESLSDLAGAELSKLNGGKGTVLIVREFPDPSDKVLVQSVDVLTRKQEFEADVLKRALGPGFKFLPDGKLFRNFKTLDPAWPADAFARFAGKLPDGGTLVSLASLPALSPTDKELIKTRNLRVVVVGQRPENLAAMVNEKSVHLAVVYKKPMPAVPFGKSELPGEWVKRVSEVLR